MPGTTTHGLPYPLDTEPVTQGDDAIQALAQALDAYLPVLVRKPADQPLTNSATFQDDLHLKVNLTPGTYRVDAFVAARGPAAADIKTTWTFGGTSTSSTSRMMFGPGPTSTDIGNGVAQMRFATITSIAGYATDGVLDSAVLESLHLDVTAAGLLTLRWAQSTANAGSTTVLANSRLYIQKMVL